MCSPTSSCAPSEVSSWVYCDAQACSGHVPAESWPPAVLIIAVIASLQYRYTCGFLGPDLRVRAWQQPQFGIHTCLQHCPTQREGTRSNLVQMKHNHASTHKHARTHVQPRVDTGRQGRTHFLTACTQPGTRTEATNASAGFWASSCMREPTEPERPLATCQPTKKAASRG